MQIICQASRLDSWSIAVNNLCPGFIEAPPTKTMLVLSKRERAVLRQAVKIMDTMREKHGDLDDTSEWSPYRIEEILKEHEEEGGLIL